MSARAVSDLPTLSTPSELDRPKLLIGEGKEEVLIFSALLDLLRIDDIRVEEYGGKNKLPTYLDALRKRPEFANLASLGVTRDADTDSAAAFASVRNYLVDRGFVTPASSGHVAAGEPSVGIVVLPDGINTGALEDLCLASLQADSTMQCIGQYLECVRAARGSLPAEISKARIHAWLAAQEPPDMRLGIAAQKGLIDWENPCFNQLKDFLRAL